MKFLASLLLGSAVMAAPTVRGRRRVKDADVILGRNNQQSNQKRRSLTQQATDGAVPSQTFYIPLPEEQMITNIFKPMNSRARAPIESLISFSISNDDTVIWYDHWEDGYDLNIADPDSRSSTTQVWGDGDPSNGCAPTVKDCTANTDKLNAGDTIVIQNTVTIPRDPKVRKYDGRDRIEASSPIAVTRGGYPNYPGSLLAGAVEVHPVSNWGKTYESPVGRDVGRTYHAFEFSSLFIMAANNNTMVKLPRQSKAVRLEQGEAIFVNVNKGDQIHSSKKIQVDLITGDINSAFELRWYSLLPLEQYRNSYVTPVGDTYGKTKVLVYNPSRTKRMVVRVTWLRASYNRNKSIKAKKTIIDFSQQHYYFWVYPKQYALTRVIPTMSGAKLDSFSYNTATRKIAPSQDVFIALSLTDTVEKNRQNYGTRGQWFDWGYPLVPTEQLTSQVLIGWGYGCTGNNCVYKAPGEKKATRHRDRSVVWITPVANARITVDFKNSGSKTNLASINLRALQSVKITDPSDDDMSGAMIYARSTDKATLGQPVDIAAAWGQDPAVSKLHQRLSLDLGTTVLPSTLVTVAKSVNKKVVTPGGELIYTIVVTNNGQDEVPGGHITIKDTLDPNVEYVPGSMVFASKERVEKIGRGKIADNSSGSKFPLDGSGYKLNKALCRRGCKFAILFKVKVKSNIKSETVVNSGVMEMPPPNGNTRFGAETRVDFGADIHVDNTLYLGWSNGKGCSSAKDRITGPPGYAITYCFKVTNTGKHASLTDVTLKNLNFKFEQKAGVVLKPGQSKMLFYQSRIGSRSFGNTVLATGQPFLEGSDGKHLNECGLVRDTDPSGYVTVPLRAAVKAKNTVMLKKGATVEECKANTLTEAKDLLGSDITYCFTAINDGTTYLKVYLKNDKLGVKWQCISGVVRPGDSHVVALPSTIKDSVINTLTVAARVSNERGQVFSSRFRRAKTLYAYAKSATKPIAYSGKIETLNKVYVGKDGGKKCGTTEATDDVTDYWGKNVTYCFKVLNTGSASLVDVKLTNKALDYSGVIEGVLPAKGERMKYYETTIRNKLTNLLEVTANPVTPSDKRSCGSRISAKDTSKVDLKLHKPSIMVESNAVIGSSTKLCRSTHVAQNITALEHSQVVYCIRVTNNGDSYLKNVKITNKKLNIVRTIDLLGPQISDMVAVRREMPTERLESVVEVNANPVLKDGQDIPGFENVKDDDDSLVMIPIRANGSVNITNMVYSGTEEDACAEKGTESVTDYYNSPVMYCFTVTNDGNTPLKDVKVKNRSFDYTKDIGFLKPGQTVTLYVASKIKDTANNVAQVEGVPFIRDKELPEVKSEDWSDVKRKMYDSSVRVTSTVYKGNDDGDKCKLSTEDSITDIVKTPVVYCFTVTNTGKVPLDEVVVTNPTFKFNKELDSELEPGESVVYSVSGEIEENLNNTVTVVGKPTGPDGELLPGVEVKYRAESSVKKLVYTASVGVTNVVYLGHDDGDSCGTGKEFAEDRFKKPVTYCFEVENTSKEVHLKKLVVTNRALEHSSSDDEIDLAPGEKKLIAVETDIGGAKNNTVYVEAIPHTPDGRKICDLEPVKATDPSGVGMIVSTPKVTIQSNVYLGLKEDGKCATAAADEVKGRYAAPVTYCLTVKNEGETALSNFYFEDEALDFTGKDDRVLHPNQSFTVQVERKIPAEKLENKIVVHANPVLENGADIEHHSDVKATANSTVIVEPADAGLSIVHTVYKGTDPSKCENGESTGRDITDFPDTKLVFCTEIKNSGKSHLGPVTLVNTKIGYSETLPAMKPNEVVYVYTVGTLTEERSLEFHGKAQPTLPSGEVIPNTKPVETKDTTNLYVKEYSHGVAIDNRVVEGVNSDCDDAREVVSGFMNTAVKYCFWVKNTGTSNLSNVVVTNEALGFEVKIDGGLPAGGSKLVVEDSKTITEDLSNNAVVTSVATTQYNVPIPDAKPTDEDDSSVQRIYRKPGVEVAVKVYKGDVKDAEKCKSDDAKDSESGVYNTAVVYCYIVKNMGDTSIDSITITSDAFPEKIKNEKIPKLDKGEEHIIMIKSAIVENLLQNVTVDANPVEENGDDISYLNNVGGVASIEVEHEELTAGISVGNVVTKAGEGCGVGESFSGFYATPVKYCISVKNEGPSYLDTVTLDDKRLKKSWDVGTLKPGEIKEFEVLGEITETTENTAVGTGMPCLKSGQRLPYLPQQTSEATSGVVRVETPADVEIFNNVYLKTADDRSECDGPDQDLVENFNGAEVVYCFKIVNRGDSPLTNIVLSNERLQYSEDFGDKVLPKGESMMVPIVRSITKDLDNTINVTAVPALNGDAIPDAPTVTEVAGSSVKKLDYSAKIHIKHVVYTGDDSTGAGCGTAASEITEKKGTPIVYCVEVTNDSDVRLNNINVVADSINYNNDSIGHLDPGKKTTWLITSSKVDLKVVNTVTVTGTPALASGAAISGAADVSASATTIVNPKLSGDVRGGDKDPYKPPSDPEKCMQDNWVDAGKTGTLVCPSQNIVSMSNLDSSETKVKSCKPGEKIKISVDGSITIQGARKDVGWYVSTDGGDALTGKCAVNGFQKRNSYAVVDKPGSDKQVGTIAWLDTRGGDNDTCGDVIQDGTGSVDLPLIVETEVTCKDENEDGILDVAICTTWRHDEEMCNLAKNIPDKLVGSCYCTRYDIPDIEVETPTVAAC